MEEAASEGARAASREAVRAPGSANGSHGAVGGDRIRRLERMTADYWRQVTRSGGAYVPPKRAAAAAGGDGAQGLPPRGSEAFQRLSWDALRRSINGLVNKVNASNIREIVRELIGENLVRGRGLLIKAIMRAQGASPLYTPVYAAIIAVLNTKFPLLGELAITRLVVAFRRSYKRNDKAHCVACATFLAHLVNQRILHDICVLQMLMLLLDRPTDDSVEIAVGIMKECGASLAEVSPKPASAVFERFRAVLHEAAIDKRVQYMIEVLFQERKEAFAAHPAVVAELDLVEEEDQITHYIMLDDDLDTQEAINLFKVDPDYEANEAEYEAIQREIIGSDDEGGDEEEEEEERRGSASAPVAAIEIKDESDRSMIDFRKTIYLTIMSSLDFEECGHKLLKMNLPLSFDLELCHMIVECASNERTYLKFYGLLAERFCKIDQERWRVHFETCFSEIYATIHRLDTNRIRNVARLFGHLFEADAITWAVMQAIILTEEETTSASRIFVKFLMQELAEFYGLPKLAERLATPDFAPYFAGLLPMASDGALAHHMRFSVNFFTAIGLGRLADGVRASLATIQAPPLTAVAGLYDGDAAPTPRPYGGDAGGRMESDDGAYLPSPESVDGRARGRGAGDASPSAVGDGDMHPSRRALLQRAPTGAPSHHDGHYGHDGRRRGEPHRYSDAADEQGGGRRR